MATFVNTHEHVSPSSVGPPSRLPVMSNQYSSNALYISKRPAPIPQPINYTFHSTERVNKFKTDQS